MLQRHPLFLFSINVPLELTSDLIVTKIVHQRQLLKANLLLNQAHFLHPLQLLIEQVAVLLERFLTDFDDVEYPLLLILQFPEVVMTAQGSQLQETLELRISIQDILQVLLVQAVNQQAIATRLPRSVLVQVQNSEEVARVADVTAAVVFEEDVGGVLVRYVHLAFLDHVNA